jgi:hypothetical protein
MLGKGIRLELLTTQSWNSEMGRSREKRRQWVLANAVVPGISGGFQVLVHSFFQTQRRKKGRQARNEQVKWDEPLA